MFHLWFSKCFTEEARIVVPILQVLKQGLACSYIAGQDRSRWTSSDILVWGRDIQFLNCHGPHTMGALWQGPTALPSSLALNGQVVPHHRSAEHWAWTRSPLFTSLAVGPIVSQAPQHYRLCWAALPCYAPWTGTRSESQRRKGELGDPTCSGGQTHERTSSQGSWRCGGTG